jgi:RNA polymerase sigma factor (sigma-70 family)
MNSHSFDECYARSFSKVLSAAIAACGNRTDAEDAVQDAYLIALRRWEQVSGYDLPEAWVLKVAMRRLWRSRRRHRHRAEPFEVTVPPRATVEETAQAREVLGALAALSPDFRIPIVMCAVLGWPQAEIAEVLRIPRNTLANRIYRGRATLAAQLGLAGTLAGARDTLVAAPRLLAITVIPEDDPVSAAVASAARWLRAGIEAEPETASLIRDRIAEAAAAPPGRRHPWWPIAAIGKRTSARQKSGRQSRAGHGG